MNKHDSTLMWGGGKGQPIPEEIINALNPNSDEQPVVMPDSDDVPEHVLDIIRPLLISYGAGGSADAEVIRRGLTRWGYAQALPEWFIEAKGHLPKQSVALLIYDLFHYALKHGAIDREGSTTREEIEEFHLVMTLETPDKDHHLYIAGSTGGDMNFPIERQINRYELPVAIKNLFKKQAITLTIENVQRGADGVLYPTTQYELNSKADQTQLIGHSIHVMTTTELAERFIVKLKNTQ